MSLDEELDEAAQVHGLEARGEDGGPRALHTMRAQSDLIRDSNIQGPKYPLPTSLMVCVAPFSAVWAYNRQCLLG